MPHCRELNSARTTTTYTNPDNLDKDIHTKLYTLLESIHERDRDQIDSNKDSVLKSINTRQIATGQVTDFNAKIQSLQDQLTALGSVERYKERRNYITVFRLFCQLYRWL